MSAPSALVLTCEACGEEAPHRVLSGRFTAKAGAAFQGTVKCTNCGAVRSVTVREEAPVTLALILSDGHESERASIEFEPDEVVRVGDRLEHEGHRIEITAIEVGERRVPACAAKEARAVWAKAMDRVKVKVSVNKGSRTATYEVDAAPDEEFEVGEVVDLGRERALVHRIRTKGATLRRGGAAAEDIVRMYGKAVRERRSR